MPMRRMPTKQEWKDYLGLSWGIIGNQKSPFPAMTRIGKLIDEYDTIKGTDRASEWFIQFQIEQATKFVLSPKNQYQEGKVGGKLNSKQTDFIVDLHDFVYGRIKALIGATDADYETKIIQTFGREVCQHGAQEDQALLGKNAMVYFRARLDQKMLKLSFRNGLAYRWDFDDYGNKNGLMLYDTKAFKDANLFEYNASLYVVDYKGAIYALGKEGEQALKHSSLLAGAGVLCAGTILIKNGQVIWLTGKSGHYRPSVMQVANVLERLSQYQVKLKQVKVFRENYSSTFVREDISKWVTKMGLMPKSTVPGDKYEPCDAEVLLRQRAWPGSLANSQSMRVE
jgi:hypothetical protein